MGVSVIADFVAVGVFAFDDVGVAVGFDADDEKARGNALFFEDAENLRRPGGIGAIVESERDEFGIGAAHAVDAPGERELGDGFVGENVVGGIVLKSARAALRFSGDAPEVAGVFEDQIVAGGNG